MGLLTLVVWVN